MELWIDDREHQVHACRGMLEELRTRHRITFDITIKVSRMDIGDYCIVDHGHLLLCIERKTWKDFAASIRDGRKENITKLRALREQTGCKLLYLIEGHSAPGFASRIGRLPYTNILAHMDHLMLRDGIQFMFSKSHTYSFERLVLLMKNYRSLEPSARWGAGDENKVDDARALKAMVPKKSDEAIVLGMWTSLRFVSEKTGRVLQEHFHFSDVACGRVPAETLATLQTGGGLIGDKRAKKILTHIQPVNVLCSIPGISKVTAEALLQEYTLDQLSRGELRDDFVLGGKKLSSRVVGNLTKYFCI